MNSLSTPAAPRAPPGIDLAAFASHARTIEVLGDEIAEVNLDDEMGLGFLTQQSPKTSAKQVSFGGESAEKPSFTIKPATDALEVVDLESMTAATDVKIVRPQTQTPAAFKLSEPAQFVLNTDFSTNPPPDAPPVTSFVDDRVKRDELLKKYRRLLAKGHKGPALSEDTPIDIIKSECEKLTDSKDLEASLRFQRGCLMNFCSTVEWGSEKKGHLLPIKPRLKGWSESVQTNIEDFDDIFEDLYDMYKDSSHIHPALRLIATLGLSAGTFHLTNIMTERSGIPGMGELMEENPELQQAFARAALAKMGGLGNLMAAASGLEEGGGGGGGRPKQSTGGYMNMGAQTRGVPFNVASAAAAPTARREMRGPSTDVNDILEQFQQERAQEAARQQPPIRSQHASVFTPPPSPSGPEFFDESASQGTNNTDRRRGRRRIEPVGDVMSLNV